MSRPAVPRRDVRQPALDRRRQYARRALRADLLVIMLWASGAIAIALYLVSGGTTQWSSASERVTSLGIVTGLVGTDFVLVMLVLAARIPIIDRTIGHDRAIQVHRSLGKPALYLLLAHGALLLIGYGMSEGYNPIAELGPMLSLPDMPLAFIGTWACSSPSSSPLLSPCASTSVTRAGTSCTCSVTWRSRLPSHTS